MAVPYQKAITANAYRGIKDGASGATIVFGGNKASNSFVTNVPENRLVMSNPAMGTTIGSQVIASATTGVQKTLSSGSLASMTKGKYVMVWLTTTLAGVAARQFLTPANYNINRLRSIHYSESMRSRLSVTAGWNYVTGRPLTTPTVQLDSFGTDDAARPSRTLPGEFVIKESNKRAPSMKDYPAKTD